MLKSPVVGALVALAAALLIGCGGGGGGGGSSTTSTNGTATNGTATNGTSTNGTSTNGTSTNGTSTNGTSTNGTSTDGGNSNNTSWIANEGWSGSNLLTLDSTSSNWVAKSVRDTPTNVLQVRARIPAALSTIPGEVYIVLPTTATNGQVFTQTSSPNAPTTGARVVFYDYRQLSTNGQIEYNAATRGNYRITVNTITATHVNVTYNATLYHQEGQAFQTHTTSGTIDVDITSS